MGSDEYDIFDLFGGREEVSKRLGYCAQKALIDKCRKIRKSSPKASEEEVLNAVADYWNVDYSDLREVCSDGRISGSLFQLIEHSLEVNSLEVLGKPIFRDDNCRKYWESQAGISPLIGRDGSYLEGELYLLLRASGELDELH